MSKIEQVKVADGTHVEDDTTAPPPENEERMPAFTLNGVDMYAIGVS